MEEINCRAGVKGLAKERKTRRNEIGGEDRIGAIPDSTGKESYE